MERLTRVVQGANWELRYEIEPDSMGGCSGEVRREGEPPFTFYMLPPIPKHARKGLPPVIRDDPDEIMWRVYSGSEELIRIAGPEVLGSDVFAPSIDLLFRHAYPEQLAHLLGERL